MHPPTLQWQGDMDGHLVLLDQTRLPGEVVTIDCHTVEDVWQAIKRLAVRGAPAIGCAAAYGVCLSLQDSCNSRGATPSEVIPRGGLATVFEACDYLATSRPTAVNLFWALQRMRNVAERHANTSLTPLAERLLREAQAIQSEDREMCAAIGRHGGDLLSELPVGSNILTHCNAGALATGGDGTALSIIFEMARRGGRPHVWVDETRPLLQGARLTAWELKQREIGSTLICDSMAAQVMSEDRVQAIITGADRIAANGDTANKIGTLSVAVLAKHFGIPFYIAAPTSTIDMAITCGDAIPIEERSPEEITHGFGSHTAPEGIDVYNPAFDVTPASLVAAIITERGIIQPVNFDRMATFMKDASYEQIETQC